MSIDIKVKGKMMPTCSLRISDNEVFSCLKQLHQLEWKDFLDFLLQIWHRLDCSQYCLQLHRSRNIKRFYQG